MDTTLDLLHSLMQRGGPVMWPIACCSIITVCIFLRKAAQWSWMMWCAFKGAASWSALLKIYAQQDPEATLAATQTCSSPYAKLLKAALTHPDLPFHEALTEEAQRTVRKLAAGLGILDTIVTLAPMLGILGTVTGIIASFNLMGATGSEDPTGIASGIAEALLTTAAGLVVSISALIPLNAGRAWHKALVNRIEAAMTAVEAATPKGEA